MRQSATQCSGQHLPASPSGSRPTRRDTRALPPSSGLTINGSGYAGTATAATNATLTLNSNGLSINVGGGGGVAVGVSNTGHTAGNTGTYSSGTMVFAGSNSLTLSQSRGGAGVHTIWLQPLQSALSGGAGISLSTTGSTIVIYTV